MSEEAADGVEVSEVFSGDNVRASWPVSLHTIRANMSHCAPDGREAMISAFLWCIDAKHPVSREEFAERIGYSANVVYKVLTGKYNSPDGKKLDVPAEMISKTRTFLQLERERHLGGVTEFVRTPTAKLIFKACDLARESCTPVMLWSVSHIGKSWALEQYAQDNNHGRTRYVRMKASSGLGGMVRRIADRVGVSPAGNTADLIDRIKRALTKDTLVILDEVHLLSYTYRRESFFACIEVIREIYDEVGCGMILCGTELMLDKIKSGQHQEMEQTLRRGVHRFALPKMPSKGDLGAIFKHVGLEFPDRTAKVEIQGLVEKPYDILRQLAKDNGLKAITERLRYGRKFATRRGEKFSWEHFVEAHLTIEAEAKPENDWN